MERGICRYLENPGSHFACCCLLARQRLGSLRSAAVLVPAITQGLLWAAGCSLALPCAGFYRPALFIGP
eukprot:9802029-Alexandrium_andersonii.AAC.1